MPTTKHLPDQPIMKYVHPADRLRPWFGVALLAATIGAFAFMLSCLWATLRVTFVGVPESAPEEDRAEESAEEVRFSH